MEEPVFTEGAKTFPAIPDVGDSHNLRQPFSSSSFQIPCAVRELSGEDGLSSYEMLELWLTAKDWLLRRGVQLYILEPLPGWACRFRHTPLLGTAAALPYAHRIWHELGMVSKTFQTKVCTPFHAMTLTNSVAQTTIACGQDLDGRDIVLKLIDNCSPEHRIYQTLLQHESLFTDASTFPGVLPPITIIDTPHKYSIVTMPL